VKFSVLHIFWFLFLPALTGAQTLDKEYVREQNIKATQLDREGKFEKANAVLDDLLALLEDKEADSSYFTVTYQTKAKIVKSLGHYKKSNELARESLRFSIPAKDSFNMADSYNTIGINHYFLADYDSTTYYYEKSFEIKKRIKTNEYQLAVSAYNLAIVFEDLGQIDKALELYREAEKNLLESNTTKNFLSDVYVGLSHISFYSGDLNKAEEYSEKAMDVGIKSYGELNPNMTFVYVSYANILESQGKYEEAIALLEKSLKIRKSTYGEYHRWTCESHYDLANSYMMIKAYDKAEKLYKKAIEIGLRIQSELYLANAQNYLAKLYIDQAINLDYAEQLLFEGLERNISIYGPKNEIVSENYRYLAKLYELKKDEEGFYEHLENSLNSANYKPDSIQNAIAPIQALQSLMLLGDWYEEQYRESSTFEFLNESFSLIDKEVVLIKYIQKNFSSDRSKINLANEYRIVFEKGLNLCWKLYQETKKHDYLEKAFELSETNRNTSLLNGLQDIKYKLFSDIPEKSLVFENQTRKELERVKMDLFYEKTANNPDKEAYSELINRRLLLSNRLDSIHESFAKNYPKYKDLKYSDKIIKISDVQEALAVDTQMITYFLGESYLYSFMISKDSVNLLRGDVAEKLVDQTNSLKKNLEERKEVEALSNNLYLFLMHLQLNPLKKNLVIIADNVLSYIPFEILIRNDGSYLLEDYIISYAGSAKLFLELENGFFHYNSPNQWAGFSPVYKDENELSATSGEVNKIADLLEGDVFINEASSKENFFKNNQNYSILHLAMHGEINQNNSIYNKLLFADGDLTSSEIYTSNSQANLAVLSACSTGFGKLEKGEGVMSMARAFHYSGIPAVVMSLWKIPDVETKTLMVYFYQHLKKGKSKSEALRMAKLDYLRNTSDKDLKHPYYWSGFVISGNTAPLTLEQDTDYFLWFGIMIVIFVAIGLYLKRVK
jgi:CHAT domain-containing protein/tetratricopeptide (TPR) repeat protein